MAWVLLLQYQIRTVMAAQGLFLAPMDRGHYGPNKDHRAHPHPKFGLSTIIWWRDMGVARVYAGVGWLFTFFLVSAPKKKALLLLSNFSVYLKKIKVSK